MEKPKKNLEESIYSRLKNVAKQRKRPVQRFLHRLSGSTNCRIAGLTPVIGKSIAVENLA